MAGVWTMKNAKAAGTRREHQAMKVYADDGWFVMRAPASIGAADFIAARRSIALGLSELKLVQVKANKDGGPYMNFRPNERAELRAVADQTGGEAVLIWWPPRGECRVIPAEEWPR